MSNREGQGAERDLRAASGDVLADPQGLMSLTTPLLKKTRFLFKNTFFKGFLSFLKGLFKGK